MMRRRAPRATRLGLLCGWVLLGGACAPAGYKGGFETRPYERPRKMPAEMLAYYNYPKQPVEADVQIRRQKKGYDILRIEFPSALNVFGSENIKVDYYVRRMPVRASVETQDFASLQHRYEPRQPAVLMLPISGGVDFSVEGFAQLFVTHGINCAIVHNRKVNLEDTQDAAEVEAYFRQTVLDNRQVLDYLVTRPDVDPNRLGCLGLSLGGIKATLVAAVDGRIRCAVLGLAGGSMADIALHSAEPRLKRYVDDLQWAGVPADILYAELRDKIRTDPLRLGPYLDARTTLLFVAGLDRVVPTWTGQQLRRAIGGPRTIYLLAGHYTSFLYLPYAWWESLSFVKKQLNVR
jgi:dienelactone hydrolase